ncbi:MAG TPA: hypothetical protein VKI19_08940 [Acidimicrobiales bacterium]|nr:hypothetical protein [Acidimicrobiales bacterium]
MSTPDARLNAAERAALADLEAAAAAADPHLAARLRGGTASKGLRVLVSFGPRLLRAWLRLLQAPQWGIPLLVTGLFFVVLGVSAGPALSLVGVAATTVGLRLVAEMARRRLSRRTGA